MKCRRMQNNVEKVIPSHTSAINSVAKLRGI
jgi:hypothetical protein